MQELLTNNDELYACFNLNCHDLPFVISIPIMELKLLKR